MCDFSVNANKTKRRWMSDRPVKVLFRTAARLYVYGASFKSRDDAIKTIVPELGSNNWIPVIDGIIRTSEIVGMEFFGESDTELAPVRAYVDTDSGRHTCAIMFHDFDHAEESVMDMIANREWMPCEDLAVRTSTIRSYGVYDMRGEND